MRPTMILTMATAGRNRGLSIELLCSCHPDVGMWVRGYLWAKRESTIIIDHEKQVVWCIVTD